MEFSVRWISNKYAELKVTDGSATIETGLLDEQEREEIAEKLSAIAEELRRK